MRPIIIGVGGSHSGAGKTAVASLILSSFKGWGAIKYTKTSLYASIIEDMAAISRQGKDTRKLLDAGAEKVLWVKSPYSQLVDVLSLAVGMVSHLPGIVVEGNSAIGIIKPDIVIFVAGSGGTMKRGAEEIARIADIVMFRSHKPAIISSRAILFDMNERDEFIRYLTSKIEEFRKRAG